MGLHLSPGLVRIEHSVADQRAVAFRFLLLYLAVAGAALVVALREPKMLAAAAFFLLFLAWWHRQVRRSLANEQPWLVELTPDVLRHAGAGRELRFERAQVGRVRLELRRGLSVLSVRGRGGEELLEVSLPGQPEALALEAGLEEWDWPVEPTATEP